MGNFSYIFSKFFTYQLLRLPAVFLIIISTLSCFSNAQSKALSRENSSPKIAYKVSKLPHPVRAMRASIIRAAKTGNMEALRAVLQKNEIQPIVDFDTKLSPIEFWMDISKDGKGRDVMAAMVEIFMKPYAVLNEGTPKEKFIWPYLAELDIRKLTARQEIDLLRLVSVKDYEAMKKAGKYIGYRATIGKDGTWHIFVREK